METKLDYSTLTPRELALVAVSVLYEKKGFDVKLYHVEDTTVITDYYVICTGRSTTHIKALADELCDRMALGGVSASHVEGRDGGAWILLDFNHVIAHVFSREDREYYNLDRLLPAGTEVDISAYLTELDRKAKGE